MSDPMRQIYRDILDIKKRLARLEAQDSSESETWTSWVPELYGTTIAGTITYSQQIGFYFRIDDMVVLYGRLTVSALTVAPTGNLRIRTLPYALPNTVNNPPLFIQSNVNLTAGYSILSGNFPAADAEIILTEMGDDVLQSYPAANLAVNDSIRFAGFYRIP